MGHSASLLVMLRSSARALRAKPEAGKLSETDSASLKETVVSGQTDVEVRLVAPHGCMVSATGAGNQEQLLAPVVTTLPPGRYQLTFYLAKGRRLPVHEAVTTASP